MGTTGVVSAQRKWKYVAIHAIMHLTPYETHGPSDVVDNSITCYHGLMHRTESTTIYTPRNEVRGVNWIHPVCLSVCMSVCPSVCLLTFRVRPVASTVQDGFFPYLVQMINSMGGCVACDNPWPWPISSRSFGLDLENRVRSVASTVLNGFFLYLAQMITIIRRCVGWYVFVIISKFECLANLKKFSALTLKKNLQFSMDSFHI